MERYMLEKVVYCLTENWSALCNPFKKNVFMDARLLIPKNATSYDKTILSSILFKGDII